MKNILAIDGGGIRGIIPAVILSYIEKQTQKPISELFSIIAGTSTGGIIAAMLTVPNTEKKPKYSAQETLDAYKQLGKYVFSQSPFRKLVTLNGLKAPRYAYEPLESALQDFLQNAPLKSALTDIILPAYDMNAAMPYFFKSAPINLDFFENFEPLMWQAARATSAAPTYFSPAEIEKGCFIDGGIFANNPAMCAYAEAVRKYGDDLFVISLGTGEVRNNYSCEESESWGAAKWLEPLLNILNIASGDTVNYQIKSILGDERFYRLQTTLKEPKMAAMDNASTDNINNLQNAAIEFINENKDTLDFICLKLLQNIKE